MITLQGMQHSKQQDMIILINLVSSILRGGKKTIVALAETFDFNMMKTQIVFVELNCLTSLFTSSLFVVDLDELFQRHYLTLRRLLSVLIIRGHCIQMPSNGSTPTSLTINSLFHINGRFSAYET